MTELDGGVFDLARQGDTAGLVSYLDGGGAADAINDRGDSLLMLAAYHRHAEAVAALLAHGADPNRVNDRGQTPLAGAVFKADPAIVRMLIDAGADPDAGEPSARATAAMFGNEALLG